MRHGHDLRKLGFETAPIVLGILQGLRLLGLLPLLRRGVDWRPKVGLAEKVGVP